MDIDEGAEDDAAAVQLAEAAAAAAHDDAEMENGTISGEADHYDIDLVALFTRIPLPILLTSLFAYMPLRQLVGLPRRVWSALAPNVTHLIIDGRFEPDRAFWRRMPFEAARSWGRRLTHLTSITLRYTLTLSNYAMVAFAGVVDGHAEGRAEMLDKARAAAEAANQQPPNIPAGTLRTITFEQADRTDMKRAEIILLPTLRAQEPTIPPSAGGEPGAAENTTMPPRLALPSLQTIRGLRPGHSVVAARWKMPALQDVLDARAEPERSAPPLSDPLRLRFWVSTSTSLRRLDVCSSPRHKAMVLDNVGGRYSGGGGGAGGDKARLLANLEDIGTIEFSPHTPVAHGLSRLESVLVSRGCDGVQGRGLTSVKVDITGRHTRAASTTVEMLVALERFVEMVWRSRTVQITPGAIPQPHISAFDLTALLRLPPNATPFIKQTITRLAKVALTVEWRVSNADLTDQQPLESPNEAVKEVAAAISFANTETVSIQSNSHFNNNQQQQQQQIVSPRPNALEHLDGSHAFPKAKALLIDTPFGCHAVGPLMRAMRSTVERVEMLSTGEMPLPAEAWGVYLAGMGPHTTLSGTLKMRVEGWGEPIDWGDRAHKMPTVKGIELYLTVPGNVAHSLAEEDDYFYAFIQQLIKLRGLDRVEIMEPVGTSRRVLRTRCPNKTIGDFTIDFHGSLRLIRTTWTSRGR